jgi:DNA-binding transcriptional LysR family regulator
MMGRALDKVDFNLLKILQILLEEQSVTRAADRLCVTQSAMSKSLARLRDLFKDPLLVRQGTALAPTPIALELLSPLGDAITRLEACFDLRRFEPSTAIGVVRIAAPEQLAVGVAPALLDRLQRKAPSLKLDFMPLADDSRQLLATGQIDVVMSNQPVHHPEYFNDMLYSAGPRVWYRPGHPLDACAAPQLADLFDYPIVQLKDHFPEHITDAARVEIHAAKFEPIVALSTSQAAVAVAALLATESIMIAPDLLSWMPQGPAMLRSKPIVHIPIFSNFRAEVFRITHRRTLKSPLHQWIALEIADILGTCDSSASPGSENTDLNGV